MLHAKRISVFMHMFQDVYKTSIHESNVMSEYEIGMNNI